MSPHRAFEQGRRRGRRPQGASHHREASRLPPDWGAAFALFCGARLSLWALAGPHSPMWLALDVAQGCRGASLGHVVGAPEPLARACSAQRGDKPTRGA